MSNALSAALLFLVIAAPWVPAIVYYARRAPKIEEALPSPGELARRRLSA
jgi:hypothetical protein